MSMAPLSLDPVAAELRTGLRRLGRAGLAGSVLLLAALGFWAQNTLIDSAVPTSGQVVVRGKPKTVQSLDGGVVDEILVRNGDRVAPGQLLLRLDPTLLRVNLDIAFTRLTEALARKARLEAEDRGLAAPGFADYPDLPFPLPDMSEPEAGQMRVFTARRRLSEGRQAQLAERVAQFERQIEGIDASIAARDEQLGYIEKELDNGRRLFDQGLMRESQILQLQRSRAEMKGSLAEAVAERARIGNSIQDAQIEVEQAERQFREEVVTDLRTTQAEIEEMTIQIVTLSRQLERVEIRAPAAGVVHEMQVTTIGGVLPPNGTVLQVIPVDEGVELELMLDPREIDRVHPGQKAEVVLTAFDQRTTPRLSGHVTAISPTVVTGQSGGKEHNFYRLGLELAPGEIERLEAGTSVVPGMPIEAFLETGEHTVMSYLLQPLAGQILRTFREH